MSKKDINVVKLIMKNNIPKDTEALILEAEKANNLEKS